MKLAKMRAKPCEHSDPASARQHSAGLDTQKRGDKLQINREK